MPKVLSLAKKGRIYLIEIEKDQNREKYQVSEDLIIEYRLIANKEFSNEMYDKLIFEINRDFYFQKVLNYALFKPRTKLEIIRYLEKLKIVEFNYHLKKLANLKLIDDELFTESYVNECINYKKIGPKKIFEDLKLKGVNSDLIKEKLSQYSQTLINENCQYWLNKKLLSLKNKPILQVKKNLVSFLINKGFSYETAKEIINRNNRLILSEIDEDKALLKEINQLKQKYGKKDLKQNLNTYLISKLTSKGYQYNLIKKYLEGSDS